MFVGKTLKTSAFVGGVLAASTALTVAPAAFWPAAAGNKAHDMSEHMHDDASHDMGGHAHDSASHGMDTEMHGDASHDMGAHAHASHIVHGEVDDYSSGQERVVASYTAPEVTLRDQNDEPVDLRELLSEDHPAALQFIFTTCSTLCPILTATMAQAEDELTSVSEDIHLISISIDPEHDTPKRLNEYAEMHRAGPNWTFLTGDFDDILRVIRAFDAAYESNNKMYHRPLTYLRASADEPWLRIEALMSARELVDAYHGVLEKGSTAMKKVSAE